jgi:hypothetical protein
VRVLVNEGRELHGGRETVEEPNASAARRAERAAKFVGVLEGDALFENRRFEQGRLCAGIT